MIMCDYCETKEVSIDQPYVDTKLCDSCIKEELTCGINRCLCGNITKFEHCQDCEHEDEY